MLKADPPWRFVICKNRHLARPEIRRHIDRKLALKCWRVAPKAVTHLDREAIPPRPLVREIRNRRDDNDAPGGKIS
jgi:hypothetical protein